MGFAQRAPGALLLPERPYLRLLPPVPVQEAKSAPTGWTWKGIFVGRVWDGDFTEHEYLLMLLAGNRQHLSKPDKLSQDGSPIYLLSDYERRAGLHLLDARCKERFESHNVACNAGRTVALNFFANAGSLTGCQYFAVGTGVGTPLSTDTQLITEFYRQALSSTAISGNQVDLVTSFTGAVGVGTFTECGLFGDGATGTANSGQLFNHSAYPFTHNSGQVLSNNAYLYLT